MTLHNIASWNIRGAHKPSKQLEIKNLIKQYDINLLGICETKLDSEATRKAKATIMNNWNVDHNLEFAPYGRIMVIWNPHIFCLNKIIASDQFIHYLCHHIPSNSSFHITFVYAQNHLPRKLLFLQSLHQLEPSTPWICLGDFNAMHETGQKLGGTPLTLRDITPLCQTLIQSNLIPITSIGGPLTWTNKSRSGVITMCKLDHAFHNPPSVNTWPHIHCKILPASLSDHNPILITWENGAMGYKTSFKFFNSWTNHHNYYSLVLQEWTKHVDGNPFTVLQTKLKSLKVILKKWASLEFGNGKKLSTAARTELTRIQALLSHDPSNTQLANLERYQTICLDQALSSEAAMMKQKCYERKELLGDRNNSYFHDSIANNHHSKMLYEIYDAQDNHLTNSMDIDNAFVHYFQEVLHPQDAFTPNISKLFNLNLPALNNDSAQTLIAEITTLEIKNALFSLNPCSTGGPDGYNTHFFKNSWPIIGTDFTAAVQHFFNTNKMTKGFNSTNLAIIPKIDHPTHVTHFRPIACANVFYKCITKIMANRLKAVIDTLVSPNQAAFITGRSISDNILITQELLRGYNSDYISPRCMLKLDIQKAFDTISWHSIAAVMSRMNIPKPFIAWTYTCISTAHFSVLRNGCSHGFFDSTRGIRQGDPISGLLFILVMEILNALLKEQVDEGKLQLHPKCKEPLITHLLFADDLVCFTKPTTQNITTLLDTFQSFKAITGLSLNSNKSEILVAGLTDHQKGLIINHSGFNEMPTNATYLGLPLISKRITTVNCLPLYEKITRKLSSWPNNKLSQSGRLTIIQSIATAMTTYWTRHYILPMKLISMIKRAMNRFLWHGDPFSTKLIPIAFSKIQIPKKHGGLGITDIKLWNIAAMGRYIDLITTHSKTLWAVWIRSNVIKRRNFWTLTPQPTSSWSWRCILNLRHHFLPLIKCNPCTGISLSFWNDPWSNYGTILSAIIPYNLRMQTGIPATATVEEFITNSTVQLPHTSSPLVREIWNSITSNQYSPDSIRVCWGSSKYPFSTSRVYQSLMDLTEIFPWSSRIWNGYGSMRNNFCLWKIMANAINTKDKLQRIGLAMDDTCVLCCQQAENNIHLFFNCSYVYHIWNRLLAAGSFYRPSRNSIEEWHNIFKHTRWKTNSSHFLLAMLKRTVVTIWHERNSRIFTAKCKTKDQLFYEIYKLVILDVSRIRKDSHPSSGIG